MNLASLLLLITLLLGQALFGANRACAGILSVDWLAPGDNLLTRDLITGREWLDLSETRLPDGDAEDLPQRFADFLMRLEPGGDLHGFQTASNEEVTELAVSAGIDITTRSFDRNGVSAAKLATFTTTPTTAVDFDNNAYAIGRTVNPELDGFGIQFVPRPRDFPVASIFPIPSGVRGMPIWVYREAVPEPSSVLLLSVSMGVALLGRNRSSFPTTGPSR